MASDEVAKPAATDTAGWEYGTAAPDGMDTAAAPDAAAGPLSQSGDGTSAKNIGRFGMVLG